MFKRILFFLTAVFLVTLCKAQVGNAPHLSKKGSASRLIVNGQSFTILGGELFNSSSTSLEYLNPVWPRMKELNLNTLFMGISWRQFEPAEKKYDFTLVDGLIREARKNGIKIGFLWFGAWKNGMSGYAPEWVLSDLNRFPRMQDSSGRNLEVLSNLSIELCHAESKTFAALMKHIAEIDQTEQTVIMMQVENEVGLMRGSRDRSKLANSAFRKDVPQELMKYMLSDTSRLTPYLKKAWAVNHFKKEGNWSAVFGSDESCGQLFMAWQYARYIDNIAEAGKKEYPLVMNVNAWLAKDTDKPGTYPSGGPTAFNLDVYRAASKNIDIFSPDIYVPEFKESCKLHQHNGNPLMIPEACAIWLKDTLSAPAKAYYTIAEEHAIGFSPFAIDAKLYNAAHPLSQAYKNLNQLMPLINELRGTNKLRGFMQQTGKIDSIEFDAFKFIITYKVNPGSGNKLGYGLIIQLSDNEYVFSGCGFAVTRIVSKIEKKPMISLTSVQEGEYLNGQWILLRDLGGDEVGGQGTTGPFFPPTTYSLALDYNYISTQKVRVLAHE